MMDVFTSVSQRDLAEFRRIMDMLQTKLGKTPDKAVEIAATFAAKTLQTSTRVAPKGPRKVRDVNPFPKLRRGKDSPSQFWHAVDNRTGRDNLIQIPGWWTKEEAQQKKQAKIRAPGLARLLWWKAAAKIAASSAGAAPTSTSTAGKAANRLMTVTQVHGLDPSIRMFNESNYALLAFRSSGANTVDTAMRRAANLMRKYVERQTGEMLPQRNLE